jgi:hypothetical protein
MFKLTGVIKVIKDEVQVSSSFKKREFVVTDSSGMYPQDILFELAKDKCDMINTVSEGQEVEVSFNLRGREWVNPTTGEVRYFNTLDAWRIEGFGSAPQAPAKTSAAPVAQTEEESDLPF